MGSIDKPLKKCRNFVKCGKMTKYDLCRECFLAEQKTKSADVNKRGGAFLSPEARGGSTNSVVIPSFEDEAALLGKCVDAGIKEMKKIGVAGLPTDGRGAAELACYLFESRQKYDRQKLMHEEKKGRVT
jgi:hypothetical protein